MNIPTVLSLHILSRHYSLYHFTNELKQEFGRNLVGGITLRLHYVIVTPMILRKNVLSARIPSKANT